MHSGFADRFKLTQAIAPAASDTNVESAAIDMLGWDGCAFVIDIGAMGSGAVFDAYVQRDDNSGFTSGTNVANAAITQIANTGNSNIAVIDVFRPTERYLRLVAVGATENTTRSVLAIQYRRASGVLPPTTGLAQNVKIVEN